MIKPVIFMNKMAMNESIATTCCYILNGNTITGSATVLHGGRIDANTEYYYVYPGTDGPEGTPIKVSNGWLNVPVVPVKTGNYYGAVASEPVPFMSGGDWWYNGEAITTHGGHIVDDDNWCFTDPTSFYTKKKGPTTLNHVGSTSAHYKWTEGNNWLADHPAQQYVS